MVRGLLTARLAIIWAVRRAPVRMAKNGLPLPRAEVVAVRRVCNLKAIDTWDPEDASTRERIVRPDAPQETDGLSAPTSFVGQDVELHARVSPGASSCASELE